MAAAMRTWFITGVSSGLGLELAKAALGRGETVAGTVRQAGQIAEFRALAAGRAHAYQLDVTDTSRIGAVVDAASKDCGGRIDVLVNNAGYGLMGAIEEADNEEIRRLFETNYFGLLNMTRAVLPLMRARRAGHIFNISSMAGFMGIAGVGHYCASKFAVEGMSESLAREVAGFGIKVTIVEPGGFRTDFSGRSIRVAANTIPEYGESPSGKTRHMMKNYGGHEPGDPVKAANAIIAVANAADAPLRLLLGPGALTAARAKLASLAKNYDDWESVTNNTNLEASP